MIKNLFLTGMPGLGKSTFLINSLKDVLPKARGYRTVRVKTGDGKCIGFMHVRPDFNGGVDTASEISSDKLFLNVTEGRHFNKEVFCAYVVTELEGALEEGASFLLMDEIGGKELSDEAICDVYRRALDSSLPCIGVIKHGMNAKHFDYDSYLKFMEELESRPDTAIVEFSRDNPVPAEEFLREWREDNGV